MSSVMVSTTAGRTLVLLTSKAKPFLDLDFRVSYGFNLTSLVKLTLDAGIQNFLNSYQKDTDMGPGRASDYIYGPNRPRRLYLSATFDL